MIIRNANSDHDDDHPQEERPVVNGNEMGNLDGRMIGKVSLEIVIRKP